MTLEEFTNKYDAAPLDELEFAEVAAEVTDCPALSEAATALLIAYDAFVDELENHIEIG